MATLTPGNRLWFYQLLSERIGTGRQVPLATVEQVIAAEGVEMEDVGCSDVRELMEALAPFAKLTVFKKGRTYVTVVPQPDWDAVLARAKEAKPTQPATGAKSWKHKKSSKDPQPAKPKPRRKKAKKAAHEQAEVAGAVAPTEEGATLAGAAAQAPEATGRAAEAATEEAAETVVATDAGQAQPAEAGATADAHQPQPAGAAPKTAATQPTGTAEPATAEAAAASGTQAGEPAANQAAPGLANTPAPAQDSPRAEASVPAAKDAPRPNEVPTAGGAPTAPAAEAAPASVATPTADAAPAANAPAAEPAPAPAAEPEPTPTPAPTPAPEPSIHFTVTYDPYEGLDDEPPAMAEPGDAPTAGAPAARPGAVVSPAPKHAPAPQAQPLEPAVPAVVAHPKPVSPVTLQADLPQSLSAEAHMKDEVLRLLWDVLPMGSDVAAVLDEDWRVARSTGALSGTRSRVTFPLRYLREDGISHVEVTLRRTAKPVAGKRWSVAFVDGSDSVAEGHGSGLEGLATEREGAWQLLGGRGRRTAASPQRELEQFAAVGSWDSLLECLAAVAAPEDWGEGRSVLRELLCVTFHRVMCEGKLATLADGSAAAFNTGLVTSARQDVCALLAPRTGDIPWELAGFYPADAPELAAFAGTPEPAAFVSSLADVALPTGANVWLSPEVEAKLGDDAAWYLSHALHHARVSYRVLAPAYDPETEALCLLLPLRVNTAARADRALALSPDGRGGWLGCALLSLDEAYACARPVCAEQPAWLSR